jgi:hypothetical protein
MKSLEEIFNSKKITDSSKKLYTSNLIRLNNNEPIINFKFLENPEIIKSKLENSKPNTQRNYYIAICSVLSELKNSDSKDSKKFQKLYDSYYKTLIEFNTQLKDQTKMTPEENTNWISMNDITELLNSKKEILIIIKGKRKLTEEMYSELLDLVILGLYTLMPPRRNIDYIYMKLIPPGPNDSDDSAFNYVDIKNGEFILNNYKTAGTYKTQVVKINPELLNIIKIYSKFIPDKSNFFLQKFNGIPFTESNQLTKKLNEIFGKRVSSTMLRKIYLTDKYSDTIESMKQDAADMGTSTSVMTTNYIKNIPNIV